VDIGLIRNLKFHTFFTLCNNDSESFFPPYPSRSAPAPAPAPAQPAPIARIVPVLPQPDPRQESASVEGVFGVAGANNVRLTAPEFSFAYDLRK